MRKTAAWLVIAASAFMGTIGVAGALMFGSEFGVVPSFALSLMVIGVVGIAAGIWIRNRQT